MKEIPILFSTDMVKALLDGRKTQTRRIVKFPKDFDGTDVFNDGKFGLRYSSNEFDYNKCVGLIRRLWPKWNSGDILWVRETFGEFDHESGTDLEFKADYDDPKKACVKWKPSIHLKKQYSRIWLEVTDIRVERVQDITEEDAIAEGILWHDCEVLGRRYKDYYSDASMYGHPDHDYPSFSNPVESYKSLWKKINGPESWNDNPWVWVVSFKVLSTTGRPTQLSSNIMTTNVKKIV